MMKIIQKRKYFYAVSIAMCLASVVSVGLWGLNQGIDFKGGTLMEVEYPEKVPPKDEFQKKLSETDLKSLTVQQSGDKRYIIRYLSSDEGANDKVLESVKSFDANAKQIRVDFIGGSVSSQLVEKAIEALLVATVGIALFIAWAFRGVSRPIPSWQYGVNAVIALIHDILITVGVFAFLGKFYGVEVGIPFIAALLTILGYSINDTIVVYDRTRENLLRRRVKEEFEDVVNRSLNETIARSFNTSFTVLLVLAAIVAFGGESVRYFAVALLVGIGVGTYSSIYVASALLVTSHKFFKK